MSLLEDRLDYDDAEELANAVQDALLEHAQQYPGTSLESPARYGYDVVMRNLGHGDDEEQEDA